MAGTPESQQPINDSRLAPTASGQTTTQNVTPVQTASNQTAANSGQRRVKSSMLLTATTIVQNPDDPDKTVKVQLFFDNGSQRTFVKNSLISKLQLMGIIPQDLLIFTFGSHKPQYRRSDYVQVDILLRDGSKFPIEADAVDHLSASQTRAPLVLEDQEYIKTHLPESFFADSVPFTAQPFEPDIVIGQDYFWDLITDSTRIQLPSGLYIIPSKLGLLIGGKQMIEVHQSDTRTVDSVLQVQCIMNNCHDATNAPVSFNDSILNPNLEHFWQLEHIGITDPSEIIEDDHAIDQFNNSVQYQDQRYYVKWPLNDNIQELPHNKLLALKRFKSLTRRFQAEPELLSKYAQIISDQVKLGIIEPVNQDVLDGRKFHYLPHHPVITPQKATTKVRVVYDGSARSRHSYSVNDCLLRGQVILPDLCGLLLRFQLPFIAMVADIEKAFLQVGLQDADRDLTRFWFYKNPSKADCSDSNLQIYRFCRVPFGIISSPFLLAATIKFHLGQYDNQVAQLILDNIYVDNVIIGVHSVQQAIEAYHRSKNMFKTASMNLREWISNSTAFNDQVPAHDKVQQTIVKVLGLRWDTQHDLFLMAGPKSKTDDLVTKRTIIQTVSSIFDPLGFASPVTLKGKLFIQKLWQKSLDWDQAVPQELQQEWESILSDLHNLDQIKIPRFMQYCSSQPPAELHAFIDASAKAYAVVIYLRQGNNNNSGFTTHFLFSKVRLSPQKAMTIPRLELLALLIGSRALSFVHQQLNIPISACFIWSDSQCCLQWLITKRPLARFVSNRVKEICQIRQKLPNCSIHYVGTEDNPADVATRGLKVAELHQSNQWWHGPKWLSSDQWPQHHFPPITTKVMEQVEKELTKQKPIPLYSAEIQVKTDLPAKTNFLEIDISKYSTLSRLLRVTVYCLRFIKSIKKGADCINNFDLQGIQSKGPILASELSIAQLYWNLQTQAEFYSDILESLQSKSPHKMVTSLGLYLDKSGVIRCKGRFQNANIFNGEFPVLLPKDSTSIYTKLVIEHFHEKSFHSGNQYTLAQLRQQFWLPSGRTAIKKTLRNCRHCRKIQGGPYHLPSMAALPKERLQKTKPFQFTGLDYLGPLWYKAQSGDREKAYICLFTCLVTRAVHLELVTDLSAQMFLNALRQFFARRGIPTKVLSDNASQLMLTKSAIQRAWLQMFNDDEVVSYCSAQGIEWKTTTPFAPWQGGIYERLAGLTKNSLKKAVGRKLLTFEQLNTLVPEIEAILNSRPLTYVYSDLESNFIIRPIDFLLPSGSIETSAFDNDPKDPEYKPKLDSSDKLIEFWQSSQASLDKFWEFWQKDYLTSLLERTQTDHVQHRIQSPYKPSEGDVVLIQEENLPRGSWKMGKILKLNVSSDRQIRSADIILPSKNVLQRSLSQLHPLEIVHSLAYSSVPEGNAKKSASSSNATTVGTSSCVKDSIGRALTYNLMKYNLSVMLFCCMFFSMLCFSPVNGLPFNRTYQLCSRGRSGHAFAVPTEFHCKLPGNKPPTKTAVELWTLRQKPQTTVAYHCYIQTHTIITHTSFVLGKGIMADLTEYSSVLPSYCWTAVNSKTWDNIPLVEISPGFWSSNLTLHVSYVWCCYDVKNAVANFFIEVGKIASIDGKKLVSDLQDLSACTPVSGHCQNQDMGVTVWNATVFQNECAYVHFGNFSATTSGKSIIVARIQGAFSYSGKAHPPDSECVPDDAFYADQGATFIRFINETPSSWREIATRRLKVPEELLEFEDLSNYKRFFMYKKILQIESREFSLIWHQLCSIKQNQLNHVWELMRLDPSLGVRAFLGRTDLYAEWAGEALVFWECRNITPTTIHWSARVNDTCYKYTPVQLEPHGPLWFVSPGSKDLVTSSPTEECNHASVHYFQGDDGNWYSAHGPVHVTTVPLEMTWKGLWSTFTFDAPSLFSRSIGHFSNFIDVQHQIQRLNKWNARFSI